MESTFEMTPLYGLTLIFVILVVSYIMRKSPQLNMFLVIVIGLLSGYVFLILVQNVFPVLNKTLMEWREFFMYSFYQKANDMGYFYIYPPLFVVFMIFIVLLYNRTIQ